MRKAANIAEAPLYAQAFLGISLDLTNFQYSRNIYQGITLNNSESIFYLQGSILRGIHVVSITFFNNINYFTFKKFYNFEIRTLR